MAPFEMCAPDKQASGLPGVNALPGQRLDEKTIDHVDLLLQRLQRLQRLAELHGGALALGAPMIFVDAVAQEDDAKALWERGRRRRVGQGVKRFKPRQGHGAARAAKHGAAGNAGERSSSVDRGIINSPSWIVVGLRGFGRFRNSFVQKLRAGDDGLHQRIEAILFRRELGFHAFDQRFVGELERPVQRIGEQFAAEVTHKLLLAVFADESLRGLRVRCPGMPPG